MGKTVLVIILFWLAVGGDWLSFLNRGTCLSSFLSNSLLWVANSFERPPILNDTLFWALIWVTNSFEHFFLAFYSFEQFFEPSFERWNSFEHFFEHSQECTYSQEHFFEWIYSHECSFGHFLKGSRPTRTLMTSPAPRYYFEDFTLDPAKLWEADILSYPCSFMPNYHP